MKKEFKNTSRRPRYLLLWSCLLIIALLVAGCGTSEEDVPLDTGNGGEVTETDTVSPDPAPETTASEDALLSYYEALVEELRAELLKEKEDRYISDHEYKTRLEELEAALKAWEEATKPTDTPTGGTPETQPSETKPAETEPPIVNTAPFDYRLENGEVIITAYKGSATTVTVPTEIDGYPVTTIDDHAFQNTKITTVILPGTVTSLGWFSFYGCFGLEVVAIPSSVTSISYAAFDGCPNLTLLCPADSYAARYAVSFGLRHEYV